MLHIAIVEDDASQLAVLINQVRAFGEARSLTLRADGFSAAGPLLSRYEQPSDTPRYDLILMDIQLPQIDGMAAATRLRAYDQDVLLIFITSMAQYAVQGYKVDALDFLVKPLSETALAASLTRALRRLELRAPSCLQIKSGGTLRRLELRSILCAESQDHRTIIHTRAESLPYPGSLASLEPELLPHGFYRCHAAFLVNLAAVDRLEGGDIAVGGRLVPLSKHRRKGFLAALAAYWGTQL